MSVEQSTRVQEAQEKPRLILLNPTVPVTFEDKIVTINKFFANGFVSAIELHRAQAAIQLIQTARDRKMPQALTEPAELIELQIDEKLGGENKEKKVTYSPREQKFLDLYTDSQTVSKGQIMHILSQAMNRPPTSQNVQNFLQGIKNKLRQEGKELVNLTPRHSGEPLYRLVPLGSPDFLKPIRQSATIPHLRSVDDEPEEFELLEDVDDADFPSDGFLDDFNGDEIILRGSRSPTPLSHPERSQPLSAVYKRTKTPSGREVNLRPQEVTIYTSIMAGKSQREIIDESFDGDESRFFNYLSSLTAELSFLGYDINPDFHRERGLITKTTYRLTSKAKQEKPFKKEVDETKYTGLTDTDIENIVNPPVENRLLTTADLRVLAALIKTPKSLLVHRLAEIISPNKISGFSEEVASLPARIDYYNKVLLGRTPLRIRSKSGDDEDPEGYYLSSYREDLSLDQKIRILTQCVEKTGRNSKKRDKYEISTQNGQDNSVSLSIVKNGEMTSPLLLKDVVFEDNTDTGGQHDNGETKAIIYHIRASNQAKIVELLFQNNPIATRILKTRLADEKDQISQRELQLLIDTLNGTLPGSNGGENLKKLGLCIVQKTFNRDDCITIAKYDSQTFKPVNLPGQYDTTILDEDTVRTRQRRRKPSHGGSKL